ncbi:hypothetical protein SAMN05720606_116182 [Paenibacillus polysaccharolyticus]|uniref:Uncharacterized protein n=1 Tax=Paenibacillus polysaccharolyticus TaxID=582692 RepID=A0A1G5KRQ0_9BACL|nr:hypothetical protein SAMN05720606_116182 [Paenibacillus polysaccharolyticus]
MLSMHKTHPFSLGKAVVFYADQTDVIKVLRT